MVNLEWYRSFTEVYRVGTVSGAAQVLHLTQPAVSQHIAALESALGQALFQRMPRRMLPTDGGKRLYTQVAEAIEKLESITLGSSSNAPQVIRIGAPQEFFAERILTQLPQAENLLYRIQFGLAKDLIQQLLAGQIDAAIATEKIVRSELEHQSIYEENFWLVAPPETEIPIPAEQLQVDLTALEQWLRERPLIAYSEELPIVRRFWRVVFGRRLDTVPQLVLPDLRMICQAVSAGLGYSVLPDYLCEDRVNSNTLKLILKPTPAVTNQIWLSYRRAERQSPRIELLLNLLISD
jgi:DNA-binding transcriptional LysR family regulator